MYFNKASFPADQNKGKTNNQTEYGRVQGVDGAVGCIVNNIPTSFKDFKVSVYKGFITEPIKTISLYDVLLSIATPTKEQYSKAQLLGKLSSTDKPRYDKIKNSLNGWTISANLKYRNSEEESIINKNPFILLDIDKLDSNTLESVRKILESDPYVIAFFLSPSRKGFKVLIQIPKWDTKQDFAESWQALSDYFKNKSIIVDTSCKNHDRLCFVSFDKGIHIKKHYSVFDGKSEIRVTETKQKRVLKDKYTPSGDYNLNVEIKELINNCKKIGLSLNQYKGHEIEFYREGGSYGRKAVFDTVNKIMFLKSEKLQKKFKCASLTPAKIHFLANGTSLKELGYGQEYKPTKFTIDRQKEGYLSNVKGLKEELKRAVLNNDFSSLRANMGLGKTTILIDVIRELNKEGYRVVFALPLKAIVNQSFDSVEDCVTVYEGGNYTDFAEGFGAINKDLEESKFIATTYQSLHRVPINDKTILLIDEAHLLYEWVQITDRVNILESIHRAKSVMFVSATLSNLMDIVFQNRVHQIVVEEVNPIELNIHFIGAEELESKGTLLQTIEDVTKLDKESDKYIIKINDKTHIKAVKELLSDNEHSLINKNNSTIFSSDSEHSTSEDFEYLMNNNKIKEGTKFIFTTSKIQEGVNIKNNDKFTFIDFLPDSFTSIVQFVGRARLSKNVQSYIILNQKKFTKKEETKDFRQYVKNKILVQSSKKVDSFNYELIEEDVSTNIKYKTIDIENNVIKPIEVNNSLQYAIDEFEIINYTEKSYFNSLNVEQIQRELKKYLPFNCGKSEVIKVSTDNKILAQKNNAKIKNTRNAKKEVIQQFLNATVNSEGSFKMLCSLALTINPSNRKLKELVKSYDPKIKKGTSFSSDYNFSEFVDCKDWIKGALIEVLKFISLAPNYGYDDIIKLFYKANETKGINFDIINIQLKQALINEEGRNLNTKKSNDIYSKLEQILNEDKVNFNDVIHFISRISRNSKEHVRANLKKILSKHYFIESYIPSSGILKAHKIGGVESLFNFYDIDNCNYENIKYNYIENNKFLVYSKPLVNTSKEEDICVKSCNVQTTAKKTDLYTVDYHTLNTNKQYITFDQTAQLLNVPHREVNNLIKKGAITPIKRGKRSVFDLYELIDNASNSSAWYIHKREQKINNLARLSNDPKIWEGIKNITYNLK